MTNSTLTIGDAVYVDEGDNIGCIEYDGTVIGVGADTVQVRTANGTVRTAHLHTVLLAG